LNLVLPDGSKSLIPAAWTDLEVSRKSPSSGRVDRSGFERMAAEVALGHVGLILGLEVSRLARNNADWYRLLDLCGLTDTLIGDNDGLYHPGLFNDPRARSQRHHVGSRTPCAARSSGRRHSQ